MENGNAMYHLLLIFNMLNFTFFVEIVFSLKISILNHVSFTALSICE